MALSYGVGAVCTAKQRKNSKSELYNQFLFCNRFLLSCTIFAFLTLNTPRSAHKEIFGAKFLSFERAAITYLRTVDYADGGRSVQ